MDPFVVWDLDGTLLDSGPDIVAAANAARGDLGRPPLPADVVRSYVGEGAARLMDQTIGESEPPEVRRQALDRFLIRYGEKLCVHTKAYPGIDALVRRLSGQQGIATNKPSPFAHRLVELMGWGGLFRVVIGGGDVARRKPAPDAVLSVLDQANVRREDAVFVGDTIIDIETAKAAGIRMICVSWGLRPREELRTAPVLVDTCDQLERALFD